MMITRFRRLYNAVDGLFDYRAISQEISFSREAGAEKQGRTAGQALAVILPVAREFDRQARLKAIISQQGIDRNGTSAHWEFFFDLVNRRATLAGEWLLTGDTGADAYRPARIDVIVRPFPPADSPLRQLVREGHLLRRQLASLWRQERKRRPDLPHRFRDTDVVPADLARQGLDLTLVEFSLSTGLSPEGRLCWLAQTRHDTYYVPFARD